MVTAPWADELRYELTWVAARPAFDAVNLVHSGLCTSSAY
jgi:hypothetical protein